MIEYDNSLDRDRLRVVIATIIINIIVVSLLTFAPWSDWRTGAAFNLVDNCLPVGFVLARRDALLARFLLFGLVVGFTELAADAWLVDYTTSGIISAAQANSLFVISPFALHRNAAQRALHCSDT